jgi:hypothetical protein
MKLFTHVIESETSNQIVTEIRFTVASARAVGNDLIFLKINPASEKEGTVATSVIKNLKTLKKEGKIDFFAGREAFLNATPEGDYLKNKFPEVRSLIDTEDFFLLVKM